MVNCTDGVDGLSASLAVVTIGTYLLAYKTELGAYATAGVVFIGALLAYLWLNAKPSSLLMGDAGSRAMGFFHRHAVAQVRPPLRLPAGGYRVHRRWQFGHSEDQPEAFSAHLDT